MELSTTSAQQEEPNWLLALRKYEEELKLKKERARQRPRYVKPQSIKYFEDELWRADCAKYPDVPPSHIAKVKFEDKTANGLTNLIERWINFHGGNARRVNTQGQYNFKTGRWRPSGSTKGAADIAATWNGKSIQIEIKAGKDRPRPDQLKQQERERAAGGIYEFIHSFDEFLELIKNL